LLVGVGLVVVVGTGIIIIIGGGIGVVVIGVIIEGVGVVEMGGSRSVRLC
jgi:hypothetical protein